MLFVLYYNKHLATFQFVLHLPDSNGQDYHGHRQIFKLLNYIYIKIISIFCAY